MSKRKALLLLLGLVMDKNGGSKSAAADLLHDLVLIHADWESIPQTPPKNQPKREQTKKQIAAPPNQTPPSAFKPFPQHPAPNASILGPPPTIPSHLRNKKPGFAKATDSALSLSLWTCRANASLVESYLNRIILICFVWKNSEHRPVDSNLVIFST